MKSKNGIGSLLQKWLVGDAGRKEEKQLKQLAKEDAFLAEALEGFQQFPEANHSDASKRLKNRLRQRTQKDRRVTLYSLPRVAAAVALLVLAGTALWYINTPGTSDNLAQEMAPTPPEETSSPEVTADISTEEAESAEEEFAAVEIPANNQNALTRTESESLGNKVAPKPSKDVALGERKKKEKLIEEAPEPIAEMQLKEEDAEVIADIVEEEVAFDDNVNTEKESEITSFENLQNRSEPIQDGISSVELKRLPPTDSSEKRLIIGVVKGRDRVPLIGANVSVKGSPQSTITDFDGRFQLEVEQGDQVVEANYTGFQSQRLDISSADNVEFLLDEGATLDEVTVTGYEKSKAKKADQAIDTPTLTQKETAAPIGGFKRLERHINKNLRYPKAARNANIEGQVIVQFTVSQDGSLSDFKILQSLGYGCDTEAIRILEKGPKWKLYSFDGSIITSYPITFEQ